MSMDKGARALQPVALVLTLLLPWLLIHLRPGADLAMDLVGVAFLARCGMARDWRWLRRPWVLAALAWWVWLVFCTLWDRDLPGQDSKAFLQAVLTIRFLLFAAALEGWVLAPVLARQRFMLSLGAATIYLAAQVLLQFTTGHNLYGAPRWGDGSLTGPFDRPRAGPTFVRMLFPALLPPASWLLSRPGLVARLAGGLLVLGAVAVMVLIGQRMPVLLTAMGLVLSALLVRRLRVPALVAIVGGGALIAASAVVSPPTFYRLVTKFSSQMEGFADSAYGQIAQRAVVIASQHPWTGRGYDGFESGCPQPRYFEGFRGLGDGGGAEMCVNHAHNWYLAAVTDAGLPGLAFFCVLVCLWLARLGRRLAGDPLRIGLFVAALLQAWPIASTSPIQSMPTGGWFFLLLGFGLAASGQLVPRGHHDLSHVTAK
jgi:O-antigen ligase